ncbi:hypothetical protein ACNKHS_13620 [Shigella flexneri]
MVNETTYAKGILPIDAYKKSLDAIVSEPLRLDWEGLRESIKTHGLRNSTLSALMPSETSSQSPDATTVLSHRAATSASKRRKTACQVVPDYRRWVTTTSCCGKCRTTTATCNW